jgi:hypothetical protein
MKPRYFRQNVSRAAKLFLGGTVGLSGQGLHQGAKLDPARLRSARRVHRRQAQGEGDLAIP